MTVHDWLGFFLAVLVLLTIVPCALVDFEVIKRTSWLFSLCSTLLALTVGLAVAIALSYVGDFVRFLLK